MRCSAGKRRNRKMILVLVVCIAIPLMLLAVLHKLSFPKQPRHLVKQFLAGGSSSSSSMTSTNKGPFAHRGGRPENTLAAITKSHELGAVGVEVDLAFSKDGEPVLIHDSTVDRTSNGTGKVQDMTLAQLRTLDFGSKTGGVETAGECIPILYEAVELCKTLDLLMLLELKERSEKSAELVNSLFTRDPSLYTRIVVISFYPNILYRVRQVNPRVLVGLVTRVNVLSTTPNGSHRSQQWWKYAAVALLDKILTFSVRTLFWRVLGVSLLLANKNDILSGRVDPVLWERRGVSMVAWTVNNKSEKNYFQDVLKLPYLSDHVDTNVSIAEQS